MAKTEDTKSTLRTKLERMHRGEREIPRFRHHSLDAYNQSMEVAVLADSLEKTIPKGNGKIKDQLRRAARGLLYSDTFIEVPELSYRQALCCLLAPKPSSQNS